MSDWKSVNKGRIREGRFASSDSDGFNGAFEFIINGLPIKVIASDGAIPGRDKRWQHVSVSIHNSNIPPSWNVMCRVKDLFWEPEDWVIQFHPAQSAYISNHSGCLHMWRPLDEVLPIPHSLCVGIKELGVLV